MPQASAIGNIHIGTIAGKLNGVIPAQTPSGWRTDQLSMPRPTCSVNSPFKQMRDAAGELDDFEPAHDLALRVGEDLAVLLGDNPRQRVVVPVQEFEELEHDARSRQRCGCRPGGKRRRRRLYRGVNLACAAHRDAAGALAGRRVEHIAPAPARPVSALAVDEMLNVAHVPLPAGLDWLRAHHKPGWARQGRRFSPPRSAVRDR